ncbi:MAG: hypothetical protein QXH19_03670 [Candidatus Bathyarchaeia archaeon]
MLDEVTAVLAALLSIILLLSISRTYTINNAVNEYLSAFKRMDSAFKALMDDLTGMMEIAERFKDPNYNYKEADMEYVISRDGRDGLRELIDVFNEIIKITEMVYNMSVLEP